MRGQDWDEEGDEKGPGGTHEEERVLKELRTVYRQADAAYAPFSCPASGTAPRASASATAWMIPMSGSCF